LLYQLIYLAEIKRVGPTSSTLTLTQKALTRIWKHA
jgi:hypothetical protein